MTLHFYWSIRIIFAPSMSDFSRNFDSTKSIRFPAIILLVVNFCGSSIFLFVVHPLPADRKLKLQHTVPNSQQSISTQTHSSISCIGYTAKQEIPLSYATCMFFRIMTKIQPHQINTIPTSTTYSFNTLFNITFIPIPTGLLCFARETPNAGPVSNMWTTFSFLSQPSPVN